MFYEAEKDRQFKDVLTLEELMDYLAIGRTTAYRLVKSGKLKSFRIGRKHKIPMQSVKEYVEKERHKG
jgi:excisionase family DNA binding protein